jgi:hypothetical protein
MKPSLRAAFLAALLAPSIALAHGISDADKQAMLEGGYFQYAVLGAKHMLTGYDHLLFLFGVVFFLTKFGDIVKFVTAFTVGHCITLIFATFLGITWNYWLVDAVIAVFIFGLIHGFGLSTRLQQLPLGDDQVGMLGRILSFNVGVEVGQIAALTAMLAVLAAWRRRPSFSKLAVAANTALMFAGGLLLLMQLHGYAHDSDPGGFRFPEEEHKHLHEDMDLAKPDPTRDNL